MATLTFLLCNINTGHQLTYWWMALTLIVDTALNAYKSKK